MRDKQIEDIYKSNFTSQTLTEDFQKIRDFVITRGNSEKNIHDRLFTDTKEKISNPEFKQIFEKYYNETKSTGMLGPSQQNILEKYLKDLHLVNQTILLKGDKGFAEKLVAEKGYKIHINLEADQLLKGSANYSTEVAAKEAKKLREELQLQYKQITDLKKDNLDLSQKLQKVNQALTNLVGNLKAKLGFTDDKINDLIQTPAPGQQKEVAVNQTKKTEQGISM